jgi:hypothetical protein
MASVLLAAEELNELGTLSELPTEPALRGAVTFLTRLLGDRAFLDGYALPLLKEVDEADEWYAAHSWEGEDGSYSLRVFVWPPRTTPPGERIAARWDRCTKSAPSDWTTVRTWSTPAWRRSGGCRGAARTGPRRSCPALGASTGSGTPVPRRPYRCTSTVRGAGRWTVTTTTLPATTFAIGSAPKEGRRPTRARKEHERCPHKRTRRRHAA